jgi:hypothetical protein
VTLAPSAPAVAAVPAVPAFPPTRTLAGDGATRAAPRRRSPARPAAPNVSDAPTWPAAELDPRWPLADPGLAAWRYRQILAAAQEQAQAHTQGTCPAPCCRSGADIPETECEVLVAVPVSDGWRARSGQATIVAYDCVGKLLTGEAVDGTVLAFFPRLALRRSIRARLRELHQLHLPKANRRAPGPLEHRRGESLAAA